MFEFQTQALEKISVKHQRLQSLLDENLLKRKQELEKEIAGYIRKIKEFESLPPSSELDAFARSLIAALMKKLESFNKKLKNYSHVNKKAYDQYMNLSEQRKLLLNRKKERIRGADKVKELVSNLDCQKDEAMNRTF